MRHRRPGRTCIMRVCTFGFVTSAGSLVSLTSSGVSLCVHSQPQPPESPGVELKSLTHVSLATDNHGVTVVGACSDSSDSEGDFDEEDD